MDGRRRQFGILTITGAVAGQREGFAKRYR
jgi:hypothetical protein